MKRVGILSDTHSLLRQEALDVLQGLDHIIHAGDVGSEEVMLQLRAVAPLTVVRGNVDQGSWAQDLPATASLQIESLHFFVLHRFEDLRTASMPAETNVVIFGHSHKPDFTLRHGIWFLNPGSAGRRRFSLPITMAVAEADGNQFRPSFISLDKTR